MTSISFRWFPMSIWKACCPGPRFSRTCKRTRNCEVKPRLTLLGHLMDRVLLVLTDVFDQVGIRNHIEINLEGPGSRVHLGIIDGGLHLQASRGEALESFYDAQFLGMRQPQAVKPCLVI